MNIKFDVPKLSLEFACKIRDKAAELGINNWSIITVDPEGSEEDDGTCIHFVMIRDLDKNAVHNFMLDGTTEFLDQVPVSVEVV